MTLGEPGTKQGAGNATGEGRNTQGQGVGEGLVHRAGCWQQADATRKEHWGAGFHISSLQLPLHRTVSDLACTRWACPFRCCLLRRSTRRCGR